MVDHTQTTHLHAYEAAIAGELWRLMRGSTHALPVRKDSGGYYPRRFSCELCEDQPASTCAGRLAEEESADASPAQRQSVMRAARARALARHDVPATLEDYIDHVVGVMYVGAYTVVDGCTDQIAWDLDDHEQDGTRRPHARLLAILDTAVALGVADAFVPSTSRGGEGRHGRLCVNRNTPAWLARAIGHAVLVLAGIEPEPAVGTPERQTWLARFGATPDGGVEIYPKGSMPHRYGNLLGLPCSRPLYSQNRTTLLDSTGQPIPWDRAADQLRAVQPLSLERVHELARRLGIDPSAPEYLVQRSHSAGPTSISTSRVMSSYTRAVLDGCSIDEVLGYLGLPPIGPSGRMNCPLHSGSQHPNTLSVQDDHWRCFSSRCNLGGSAIDLIRHHQGITYIQARDWLAQKRCIPPRPTFLGPSAIGPSRVVESADPAGEMLTSLATRGAAIVDVSPPGTGKTWRLTHEIIPRLPDDARTTLILASSHNHHSRELAPLLSRVGADYGQWPRPNCPRGHDLASWSSAGWSYSAKFCAACPQRDRDSARIARLPVCSLKRAQAFASRKPVILAQQAALGDALWAGIGSDATRLIVDESPTALLRGIQITTTALSRVSALLDSAISLAYSEELQEKHLDVNDTSMLHDLPLDSGWRSSVLAQVVPGFAAWRSAVEAALSTDDEVVVVPPPSGQSWRSLLRANDVRAVVAELERLIPQNWVPPPNLFPLATAAARQWALGEPQVLLRNQDQGTVAAHSPATGYIHARTPTRVSVVVLDATADATILERLLGRPVKVVSAGSSPALNIRQVVTRGMRSRTRLAAFPGDLDRDARVIATTISAARLGPADAVGLISYSKHVDALAHSVRQHLRAARVRVPEIRNLYWFNCRGSNLLDGVALGVLHGTPTPRPISIREIALLVGASPDALRERPKRPAMTYESAEMAHAHRALLDSELRQGLGRFSRGGRVPQHGVLVLSNVSLPVPAVRMDERAFLASLAVAQPAFTPEQIRALSDRLGAEVLITTLGIDRSTLHRWRTGISRPQTRHVAVLRTLLDAGGQVVGEV